MNNRDGHQDRWTHPRRRRTIRPGTRASAARTTVALATALALTVAACGGDDDSADATATPPSDTGPRSPDATTAATTTADETTAPTTTAPTTAERVAATTAPPDRDWEQQIEARCAEAGSQVMEIAVNDGTAEGIAAEAAATKAVFESDPFGSIALPSPLRETLSTLGADAVVHLADSIELANAGDVAAAQATLDQGFDRLSRIATAIAIAGARCGYADPVRVDNADLTVPMEMGSDQLGIGFGSIWVSEVLAGRVVRLDPDTGDVQAEVDVGDMPLKLQSADGSMWVRTAESYVAIDPATNAVAATLAKAEVGPDANRSWALDGAMWICDGRRLHRYDPATLTAVATIGIDVDCGQVYATEELVVAWSYNEDPGESGTSAAAFVDPTANAVIATVDLPVDVGVPVVLDEHVFLPGGSQAVVVDRNTWSVTAVPDLGRVTGGSQTAFDGTSIYVPTAWPDHAVLVVDGTTFAVTDTIEPLGVNSVIVDDAGNLWVAKGQPINAVQRFDR